jgi:hypothetical protein
MSRGHCLLFFGIEICANLLTLHIAPGPGFLFLQRPCQGIIFSLNNVLLLRSLTFFLSVNIPGYNQE